MSICVVVNRDELRSSIVFTREKKKDNELNYSGQFRYLCENNFCQVEDAGAPGPGSRLTSLN